MARAKLNMLRNTFERTTKENVVKLNMHRQKRLEEEEKKREEKRQDAQVHSAVECIRCLKGIVSMTLCTLHDSAYTVRYV